ncbi:MAG: hypothetical protein A2Y25_03440 [Candidatus Melainabacteria bacterium GWF2_37_15]|nr:MAG: hypothetical protein A2Y25_03440 [Candidatus Melainabacteria bacterium GWF2_37_15]
MKIAAISDIHGNLEALKAVIDDINKEKINKIFVCGDLAVAGPEPAETIDFLLNLKKEKKITFIQGNTDKWLFNEQSWPKNETMINAIKYTQQALRPDQLEFLKSLPEQHTETIGKLSIRLVHEESMAQNAEEDIILFGHTHLPELKKINRKSYINTGSVGRPFTENPLACYLILNFPDPESQDFSFEHKFIKYDKEATAEKLTALNFKGSEKLAQVILNPSLRHELFS